MTVSSSGCTVPGSVSAWSLEISFAFTASTRCTPLNSPRSCASSARWFSSFGSSPAANNNATAPTAPPAMSAPRLRGTVVGGGSSKPRSSAGAGVWF